MTWITELDDPRLEEVLQRTCDLCGAPVKQLCTNPIVQTRPLPGGRLVHIARTLDRSKE